MATKGFILIETAVGKSKEVVDSLRKVEGVRSVDQVTGPYDVIAVIEGEDLTVIGELVTARIPLVPGLSRMVTCLVVTS